jgi:hypothetical protein
MTVETDHFQSSKGLNAEHRARLLALLRRKMEIEKEVEERARKLQVAHKTCSKVISLVLAGRMSELEG